MRHLQPALLPIALVLACTSEPSDPNADSGTTETSTSTSDDATSESETGDSPVIYPEPAWSVEFPGDGLHGVVLDFEINATDETLVLEAVGGEFESDSVIHKLGDDGAILWSVPFDESPMRICARQSGGAYVLLDASAAEDTMGAPILRAVASDGTVEWTTNIPAPTPPNYNDILIACEREADGVFAIGGAGEDNAFLVHYDAMGTAGDWIEPLFTGEPSGSFIPTSLALTDSGQLLLGAWGSASGSNEHYAYVNLVSADGTLDQQVELDSDMWPFVVARDGMWASAGRIRELMQDVVRVDALAPDLTSTWTTIEGQTVVNAGTHRPVAVDDQGRILVMFPGSSDIELRVAIYEEQASPELVLLSEYEGLPQALGIDSQGRLLVGGRLTVPNEGGIPNELRHSWIAAYDLSSL